MYPFIGPVPAYAIFYVGGIILHFVVGRRIANRAGLKRRVWIAASVCYLVSMTLGAKILFDLSVSDFDLSELLTVRRWTRGGLWGGLLAYFPLAILCVLLLSERKAAALDLVATAVPIPWIMAKLGCLFNGCCYGKPSSLPWAITFPEGARGAPAGVPLHPMQLYEIAVMLILLAVFSLLSPDRWRGTKVLWFLLIYGVGRALTDFLRGDMERSLPLGSLTMTQRICLGAAAGAMVLLVIVWRTRSSGRPALSLEQDVGQP
jgi:phosphatidylglycerol:prolipoprotein diacylglycerol transferase